MYITRARILRAKKVLDALTSETKLRILKIIMERPSSASDIAKELGYTLPAVTSHLKDLEEAGLIRLVERRKGRGRPAKLYSLSTKRVTIDIDLESFLELSSTDNLEELAKRYVEWKLENGLNGISSREISKMLNVPRSVAIAIVDLLNQRQELITEPLKDKCLSLIGEDWISISELSENLKVDRKWLNMALKEMEEEGLVEVRRGKVRKVTAP